MTIFMRLCSASFYCHLFVVAALLLGSGGVGAQSEQCKKSISKNDSQGLGQKAARQKREGRILEAAQIFIPQFGKEYAKKNYDHLDMVATQFPSDLLLSLHLSLEPDLSRRSRLNHFHGQLNSASYFFSFSYFDIPTLDLLEDQEFKYGGANDYFYQRLRLNKGTTKSTEFKNFIQLEMKQLVNPVLVLKDEWRFVFLKMALLTDLYSDQELLTLAQKIETDLSLLKFKLEDLDPERLKDFKDDIKDVVFFANNIQRFRSSLDKAGVLKILDKKFQIRFPTSLEKGRKLESNMTDTGNFPKFNDLKKGIQENQLINPLAFYIGRQLKDIPWEKVESEISQFNPAVSSLSNPQLKALTVYHRTREPWAAKDIENGNAFISLGKDSIFGGAATWGDGVYAGFSKKLKSYGPFRVPLTLNPQSILGQDLDIFLGQKDGVIVVIKTDKALEVSANQELKVTQDRNGNSKKQETSVNQHPDWDDSMVNHLEWFAKMAPTLSLEQKKKYFLKILDLSSKGGVWGPFELWVLFHLDQETLRNREVRTALKSHYKLQMEDLSKWPLKMVPFKAIDQYMGFLKPNWDSFEKGLKQSSLPIRPQIANSENIPLIHFPYFEVPESVVTHFKRAEKAWKVWFELNSYMALGAITEDAEARYKKLLNQGNLALDNLNLDSVSDLRYTWIMAQLWIVRGRMQAIAEQEGGGWALAVVQKIEKLVKKENRLASLGPEKKNLSAKIFEDMENFRRFN